MAEAFPDNEGLRIMLAIRDGRMTMNGAGRYVIEGQLRPDRRTREKLRKRGYIDSRYEYGGRGHYWLLMPKGVQALRSVGFDSGGAA